MFVFVAGNFLAIPLAIDAHPHLGAVRAGFAMPGIAGGFNSTSVLLIIAIVGTTVAPWQLFFQQSNIVDKRITTRWINYERADTVIGSFVVVLGAPRSWSRRPSRSAHPLHGHFSDAGAAPRAARTPSARSPGICSRSSCSTPSIIGAGAVTLSTSYAFGDVFGLHHSLHRRVERGEVLLRRFAAIVAAAAGIVLIPGAPLGVITTAVQALAGRPAAERERLPAAALQRPRGARPVGQPRLAERARDVIVGVLFMLSAILTATTLFPHIDVTTTTLVLFGALALGLAAAGGYVALGRRNAPVALDLPAGARPLRDPARAPAARERWTMPPLELLDRPIWSRTRTIGMYTLRGYLVIAVLMLIVKAVELGLGH